MNFQSEFSKNATAAWKAAFRRACMAMGMRGRAEKRGLEGEGVKIDKEGFRCYTGTAFAQRENAKKRKEAGFFSQAPGFCIAFVRRGKMRYIEVRGLTKTFTLRKKREKGHLLREKVQVQALKDLSFSVEEGELLGYIGPNGAGKSTTVKILSGILTPDAGDVEIDGLVPWKERKKHVQHIGVVFGQRSQLWWDVPICDSYRLLRDIYRVPEAEYKERLDRLVDALDLSALLKTPLRQLSLGQKMRAELCGSLLHGPKLLFLDEPTIGLDAVSKLALREFLREENQKRGTTILLTTHDMEDIAALCERVMVLGHGKKLYDGALPKLLSRYDTVRAMEIKYKEAMLPALPPACRVERAGDGYRILYAPDEIPTAQLLSLLQSAGEIRELTAQPQNIDHLIAAMYREMDL